MSSGDAPKLLTFGSSPTLLIRKDAAVWCAADIPGLELEQSVNSFGRATHRKNVQFG
ncbi:hypothetical protein N5079_14755 [Planotetraspora sp. A-T 1434]|uniref:hypothetical protein n=1 Tax=Planotetraspora sp. A-T 1434 TaxID=2979219 RepID=UPI0021BFA4ED|nr:hypothetical protein [Planotetraspora sp. A-T 1434]MCT9931478.1 hypothetical protein [Planotetraspora sp. A-T 1434]